MANLQVGEEETGAADDVVGGGVVGSETKEADRVLEAIGAEDEVAFGQGDVAKEEQTVIADGVEGGLRLAVGRERGVIDCLNASVWAKS